MGDVLFSTVEKLQGEKPWGRFLDAGTGVHSLKWIQSLDTEEWVAITADVQMKTVVERDALITNRPNDKILIGNWIDESFCSTLGEFDCILADYLIGAVDGFSPFEQDVIIKKLRRHLKPNGRIYLIGMNPIPDSAPFPSSLVCEVRRARDACIQLAAHRPYREFPMDWIVRHMEASNFKILNTKTFTILHSENTIFRQIQVGYSKLSLISNPALRSGLEAYLNDLK